MLCLIDIGLSVYVLSVLPWNLCKPTNQWKKFYCGIFCVVFMKILKVYLCAWQVPATFTTSLQHNVLLRWQFLPGPVPLHELLMPHRVPALLLNPPSSFLQTLACFLVTLTCWNRRWDAQMDQVVSRSLVVSRACQWKCDCHSLPPRYKMKWGSRLQMLLEYIYCYIYIQLYKQPRQEGVCHIDFCRFDRSTHRRGTSPNLLSDKCQR